MEKRKQQNSPASNILTVVKTALQLFGRKEAELRTKIEGSLFSNSDIILGGFTKIIFGACDVLRI